MGKGSKHTCESCGTKYYDLGNANHPCPKCGNVAAANNIAKSKKTAAGGRKGGSADKPEEKLKTLILFKVSRAIRKLAMIYSGVLMI